MKIVITQPNYLPWLGYFGQLNSSDKWIVLDNVQFARREWQNRNRIINSKHKIDFLSIQIQKSSRSTKINDIQISADFSVKMHLQKIKANYCMCDHFSEVYPMLEEILNTSFELSNKSLAVFNVSVIKRLAQWWGISIDIDYASRIDYSISYKSPTERLVEIAKYCNAKTYLSSIGAKQYMQDELSKFAKASIDVVWQEFRYTPYSQFKHRDNFISHMSCIDYLFNQGTHNILTYIHDCHSETC